MTSCDHDFSTRTPAERGTTLIELMVTMAVMLVVMGGAMLFLISQTRTQTSVMLRSDTQFGGQLALSLLSREIERAGLGLPRRLAIKEFTASTADCGTGLLSMAHVDFRRQWTAASTDTGSISLESATPSPAAAGSVAIPAGRWLFIFRHATIDTSASQHGHGMALVPGGWDGSELTIGIDNTNEYSQIQDELDTSASSLFNKDSGDGRLIAVLVANVTTFGVDCTTDAAHPYLYMERAGSGRFPIASTVTALQFQFQVDTDGDGQADDSDSDGVPDLVANPADLTQVMAVEVQFTLRSDDPDPAQGTYRTQDFQQVIQTFNIRPNAGEFVFVDNTAL